ncbi:MAG: M23 family metallopeptidase [Intrasporangiaceae bacterium]|nr:M23 family metallopeptidase [Intrasporangiaceae bacterium]
MDIHQPRHGAWLSRSLTAVVLWLVVLVLLSAVAPLGLAAAGSPQLRVGWGWPLDPQPQVERTFERPPSRYGAGHRGIDVSAAVGAPVTAVAAGVVTHSGMVAGRGTVTVRHDSGISSTYEPLEDRIAGGETVDAGTVLGTIGTGSHCADSPCLHLGARLGEEYLDPLLLLTRVRIVLLPLLPEPYDTR